MRTRLYLTAAVLAALVLAFLGGRFTGPTKTITKTETKVVTQVQTETKYVDRVVYQDRVQTQTHVVRVYVKEPSGAVTMTETRDTGSLAMASQTTDTSASTSQTASQSITQATTKVVTTERPGWSGAVAALYGSGALNPRQPRVELDLDRRLIATLWVGVRGSYDLQSKEWRAGPVLRLEW